MRNSGGRAKFRLSQGSVWGSGVLGSELVVEDIKAAAKQALNPIRLTPEPLTMFVGEPFKYCAEDAALRVNTWGLCLEKGPRFSL